MRKYTSDISKLYENIGYEKIEKGKTYTTAKGAKLTINDIFIDATSEMADAYVSYNLEKTEGEKVDETNRFGVVVDLLRNS